MMGVCTRLIHATRDTRTRAPSSVTRRSGIARRKPVGRFFIDRASSSGFYRAARARFLAFVRSSVG